MRLPGMLQADPFLVDGEAALVFDAETVLRPDLFMAIIFDIIDINPFFFALRYDGSRRISCSLMLRGHVAREFIPAISAAGAGERQQRITSRASLSQRRFLFAVKLFLNRAAGDCIYWTMAHGIAGKVQHQTILFSISHTKAAADLLDEEPG